MKPPKLTLARYLAIQDRAEYPVYIYCDGIRFEFRKREKSGRQIPIVVAKLEGWPEFKKLLKAKNKLMKYLKERK